MGALTAVATALSCALLLTLAHALPENIIDDGDALVVSTPAAPPPDHELKLSSDDQMMMEGLYQGDIMLTPEQKAELKERKIITLEGRIWPNQSIPYRFGDSVMNRSKTTEGIDHWREHTCLNFTEVPDDYQGHHLIFIDANKCYSWIGMVPSATTGQNVWITDGCVQEVGPTIHEIFHAAGAFHEQSRMDRDDYIEVLYDNIMPDFYSAFDKSNITNNYNVGYDYHSIMHYGLKYFTLNDSPTILPLDRIYTPLIGNRDGFTFRDKLLANTVYECLDMWLIQCSLPVNPCQNEGYIGKNCSCVCHPGTSGSQCESLDKEYNDAMLALISPSSETILDEGNVTSEGYPVPDQDGSNFVKQIIAPRCYKVKLVIDSFNLYGRISGVCNTDAIVILMDLNGTANACPTKNGTVTQNGAEGCLYCGDEMPDSATFMSVGDRILITYYSYDYTTLSWSSSHTGFSGSITHEMIPGCDPDVNATSTAAPVTTTDTPPATSSPSGPPPFVLVNSGDIGLHFNPGNYCQSTMTLKPRQGYTQYGSNYTYHYASPGYPGRVPPNITCIDTFYTDEPRYLNITLEENHLHLNDTLMILHAHMIEMFVRTNRKNNFILPSAVGSFIFASDMNKEGYGFKFRAEVMNSPCHTVFNITGDYTSPGGRTVISGPSMRHGIGLPICEYWFIVPEGKRLKLKLVNFVVGLPTGEGDYVLFDTSGDVSYMTSPVKFFGNLTSIEPEVTSDGRYLPMLYYGMEQGHGVYNVTIEVLNATSRAINPAATRLIEQALGQK